MYIEYDERNKKQGTCQKYDLPSKDVPKLLSALIEQNKTVIDKLLGWPLPDVDEGGYYNKNMHNTGSTDTNFRDIRYCYLWQTWIENLWTLLPQLKDEMICIITGRNKFDSLRGTFLKDKT